jgi:hypothetical protein
MRKTVPQICVIKRPPDSSSDVEIITTPYVTKFIPQTSFGAMNNNRKSPTASSGLMKNRKSPIASSGYNRKSPIASSGVMK